MRKLNLIGQRFGRLTVITKNHKDKWGQWCWLCKCDCGNEVIVRGQSLKSGGTQSCGCLQRERIRERIREMTGENHPKFKHGTGLYQRKYSARRYARLKTASAGVAD